MIKLHIIVTVFAAAFTKLEDITILRVDTRNNIWNASHFIANTKL